MTLGPQTDLEKTRRNDPDDMDEDINKTRKINSETEEGKEMSSIPDDQPDTKLMKLDDEMLESMTEIDRNILAGAILGVDITEAYFPERFAKVAAAFGLRAGSSLDLTN